ncbi:hypothetical protein MJG53_002223 [Ovis ammon polii x Ovis aries]|uniref:Uncharacterized protein n=1 Tax=Ovis ammon polii x Ovis aries TaxID=2918886 RepID=A0ACB9VNR5_9CETA|nr:hypothetical protein MJG53_002223 [Ovis ammon polii x Ovis aries]
MSLVTLLQCEIFLDQGSNPCPLLWQADSEPVDHEELELHAEDTRSLKTTKESQGCGPEGQSQKQWVKNSCPDLPKHLDTKMVPQPLKESAVLTPRVPALPKTGSIGDWEVTAESQEALGPDRHAEKEFCMDPPGDNCGNGLSLGFEMRCEDEDRISEQDLFEDFPGALSKCTAGDDCYPHDWGEDSENENESESGITSKCGFQGLGFLISLGLPPAHPESG